MLSSNQFKVLSALAKTPSQTQRSLAGSTGLSLGTVFSVLTSLKNTEDPLLDDANVLTDAGMKALSPYKVENAVIMAAGMSTRFAPISYERPKGLLTVKGEVLVERQIRQLRDAGINEIYLVLGYKKEEFFYLEDAFGVHIRINDEFQKRNNNSTIKCVEDILSNTYICSSDDYFATNPFETYEYCSNYAGVFIEGETDEYCFELSGKDNHVKGVHIGGCDSWVMLGHAYWDREFSNEFIRILDDEYNDPDMPGKLWEDIYIDHIDELSMNMREFSPDVIWEFDSLDEVSLFDPAFIQNVDSDILDNICKILDCSRSDISGIEPLKQGQKNLSFKFCVQGNAYVYRHPSDRSNRIVNRESEAFAEEVAFKLDLDTTFIYEDPRTGWKLSKYIEGARWLDYENPSEVSEAISMMKALHNSEYESPWTFDIFNETMRIINLLNEDGVQTFKDSDDLLSMASGLYDMVKSDDSRQCFSHNSLCDQNILVAPDGFLNFIDWEYSAMSDYANDLGVFVCCSPMSVDEACLVFEQYFERELTLSEKRHCLAYVALHSFYWLVWSLQEESQGKPTDKWLYKWYRGIKDFGTCAFNISAEI